MRRLGLAAVLLSLAAPAAEAHTLSYGQAKRAAQERAEYWSADARVTSLMRTDKHRYYAQARWEDIDLDGCRGCGYNPSTGTTYDTAETLYCSAELSVRFRSRTSRRTRVGVIGRSCF